MRKFKFLLTAFFLLPVVQPKAQCTATGSHYTANYSTGWNYTDLGDGNATTSSGCNDNKNGSIYSSGNTAYFFSAKSGRELRITSGIPVVSNLNWTMDFTLQIGTNPGILASNSPAVVLASLTADPVSLFTSCSGGNISTPCSSYPQTNTDAIWIELLSDPSSSCTESQDSKNWRIVAHARNGSGAPTSSAPIAIPSGVNGTYYIRLQRTTDNSGTVCVYSNSNFQTHVAGSPQCLAVPGNVGDLDNLSHEIVASESFRRVFNGTISNLKIDNSTYCSMQLNPSFTMPSEICGLEPFVVNGSASTTSGHPITGHFWVIQKCDANGNHYGPVWYSPAIGGAPTGNYTINPATVSAGNMSMQEWNYYKVSLIVQNCANPWASSSQVIYVKPVPVINMGNSSTTATPPNDWLIIEPTVSNSPVPSTVLIASGAFYWSGGTLLSSGTPPFQYQTTQSAATTYYLTAYNSTGCIRNLEWQVAMRRPRPEFTPVVTLSNEDEFRLDIYPIDPDGFDYPGFTFQHIVEELDQNGDPYYAHSGSDCWTRYPEAEHFKGFVSTEPGDFTQLAYPDCGDPGVFKAGRTYRVTTLMKTNEMDEEQYSVLVYLEKSGEIVVKEDKNAPDMTHLLQDRKTAFENDINIFPNPSSGIFSIELEEGSEGSLIEVTNALGENVKSFEAKDARTELDMTGFAKGIYIVAITTNGNTTTKKIVLE